MDRLQRSTINLLAGLGGWAAPVAVNFVATPLLLRGLGADGYGLQSIALAVVGYFVVMDMGLDIATVKFLAEYRAHNDTESENRLLNASLQVYAAIGLVGGTIMFALAEFFATGVFRVPEYLQPEAVTVFKISAVGFFANMLMAWGGSVPQGLQRYDISHLMTAANNIGSIGLGLIAIYVGFGLTGFVFARVAVGLLVAVGYALVARRLVAAFCLRPAVYPDVLHRMLNVSVYGLVLRVSGTIITGIDRALIGVWLGTAALAFYTVPNLVALSIWQMIGRAMGFLFPMMSELSAVDQHSVLQSILIRSCRFIAALSTLIFVPLIILADHLLALWVGTDIAVESASTFRLLLLGSYVTSLSILAGVILLGLGLFREFSVYTVSKSLAITLGCIVLIKPMGISGAAISVLLGSFVDAICLLISLRRYVKLGLKGILRDAYMLPIFLGVGLIAPLYIARPVASSWPGALLSLGSFALVYATLAIFLGIFGDTERRVVLGLFRTALRHSAELRGILR